jgi:hypothetical protein
MAKKNKRNFCRRSEKGFSFAFDGVVAGIVIMAAILFVSSSSANTYDFASQKIVQKQIAQDILNTGIDLNKFQGLDSGEIEGLISSTLPLNYDYQLVITKHLPTEEFTTESTNTYGSNPDFNAIQYIEAKKIFAEYYANDVNRFYRARLRVWVQ